MIEIIKFTVKKMSNDSKVGFSAINITPKETGIPLGGYMVRYSTGVHDDIHVRSIYLSDGSNEVLLISTDLLMLYGIFVSQMREIINKETGVPKENILISSLHNHSSPDSLGLTGLKGFLKYTLRENWFKEVRKKIIKSAVIAKKNAENGLIGAAQVPVSERIAINRRHPKRDLHYKLTILKFNNLKNELIGLSSNYAMHATTLSGKNLLVSAEYAGYLNRKLEKRFSNVFSNYFNGPCGDLNPNLFPKDKPYEEIDFDYYFSGEYGHFNDLAGYHHTKYLGEKLADMVIENVNKINVQEIKSIKVQSRIIEFPVIAKHPKMKLIDRILGKIKIVLFKFLTKYNRSNGSYFSYFLKKGKLHVRTELQLIKINEDIMIIAVPVELFSELGDEMVKKSPIKNTFVVGYANDFIGYVYPISECEHGGYEIFGLASFAGITAGDLIKKKVFEMIKEIK